MGTGNLGNHRTDIVIVGWNHTDLIDRCLQSIAKNTEPDAEDKSFRVTYVDNGSEVVNIPFYPNQLDVFLPENTGYCHGNNVGLALSLLNDSEFVLLLNNDAWIPDGDTTWLERMINVMVRFPAVGAVGAVSDNVFGHQRRNGRVTHPECWLGVSVLIGFCLLLRKEAIKQVGLLDERFDLDGNFSDFDYSIRLQRAGWQLAIAETVFIHHEMSVTQHDLNFAENLVRNRAKLFEKWDRDALKLVGL